MNMSSPPDAEPKRFSMFPLLWLAIVFSSGIACSYLIDLDWRVALVSASLLIVLALLVRYSSISNFIVVSAFFFAGVFCYQFEIGTIADNRVRRIYDESRIASGTPVEIEGALIGRPEPAYDGAFIKLALDSMSHRRAVFPASGTVRLFLPLGTEEQISDLRSKDLRSGDVIRTACELIREDQYLNPGVMPRRQLLDQQGIDATCTVKSPLLIEVDGERGWISPVDVVYEQRQWLIDEFRSRFSVSTAGVMIASLLGDKHFLDKDTADVFRDGGTFHVLVISGLHITFIGGILFWIVSLFGRNRIWQFAIVCSVLWLYTLAVGAEVPVVRASVMFTALLLGRAIYRNGTLLNTLGLSCLMLLAWRPADLFNPSFQLTVVSVFAIVGMAFPLIEKLRAIGGWMPEAGSPFPPNVPRGLRRFCETVYWREHVWAIEQGQQIWGARIMKAPLSKISDGTRWAVAWVFEGILISVIAQLWMLPLLVYYFHRVSPASVILNLWVGAVMAAESFAAILAVLFAQFSETLSMPLVELTNFLNSLLVEVPRIMSDYDLASFRVPVYTGPMKAAYLVYLLPFTAAALLIYKWDPFALARPGRKFKSGFAVLTFTAALMASVIIFHPFSAPEPAGLLRVEFLDVGQGDSTFITFPNGETMLIDGGGKVNFAAESDDEPQPFESDQPRIGEMVVSEFLWEKGYSKIDRMVVTHADADHSQGLAEVMRNFSVGEMWAGTSVHDGLEMTDLTESAKKYSIPVMRIGRGEIFEISGVTVEVLWPVKSAIKSGSDNNSSVVLRLIYGESEFLFTGDIEKETEEELTTTGTDLNADIIKVPHHGSRTSSTGSFVNAVSPRLAIIPVGRRSMFGHPHPEVVERWKSINADVKITGEKGTITVETNGKELNVKAFID